MKDNGYSDRQIEILRESGAFDKLTIKNLDADQYVYRQMARDDIRQNLREVELHKKLGLSGDDERQYEQELVERFGGDYQKVTGAANPKILAIDRNNLTFTPTDDDYPRFGKGEPPPAQRLGHPSVKIDGKEYTDIYDYQDDLLEQVRGGEITDIEMSDKLITNDGALKSLKTTGLDEDIRAHEILNSGLPVGQNWDNADYEVRGDLKDGIVTNLADKTEGIDYGESNNLIRQWAATSNDSDMRSLSLQEAASQEFGVPLSEWQEDKIKDLTSSRDQKILSREGLGTFDQQVEDSISQKPGYFSVILPDGHDLNSSRVQERLFLRSMYKETQTMLAEHGYKPGDFIKLYRGYDARYDETTRNWPERGEIVNYSGNPMESWSASRRDASGFGDTTIAMYIPIENIVGTSRTGFGCINEGEFIIMGSGNNSGLIVSHDMGEHGD